MKTYYVHLDDDKYITSWSEDNFEEEQRTPVVVGGDILDFEIYFIGYKEEDGIAVKDTERYQHAVEEEKRGMLRYEREFEVFPIVNRGELFYRSLTEEQKDELQVWYEAWLDVTDTLEPPPKPEWLV